MTENNGFDRKDKIKEVIWAVLLFIGLFAYGCAMLFIISFVIHSWMIIDVNTIIGGAFIFASIVIIFYIVKKLKVSNKHK